MMDSYRSSLARLEALFCIWPSSHGDCGVMLSVATPLQHRNQSPAFLIMLFGGLKLRSLKRYGGSILATKLAGEKAWSKELRLLQNTVT
jgi:hypothetical protein